MKLHILGIDRADEPYFDADSTVPEHMNNLFEFIDQSGLNIVEIKQVFRDYDSFYHGDIRRPDYVEEAKMDHARNQIDDE